MLSNRAFVLLTAFFAATSIALPTANVGPDALDAKRDIAQPKGGLAHHAEAAAAAKRDVAESKDDDLVRSPGAAAAAAAAAKRDVAESKDDDLVRSPGAAAAAAAAAKRDVAESKDGDFAHAAAAAAAKRDVSESKDDDLVRSPGAAKRAENIWKDPQKDPYYPMDMNDKRDYLGGMTQKEWDETYYGNEIGKPPH